jgi:transcriptional regulator with XRE-family HTH domain
VCFTTSVEEGLPGTFVEEVGRRLRAIRRQQHLSLEEVEERSNGRWSASAIGAYERGYRTLSLGRLRELAEFYNVPISVLVGEAEHHHQQPGAGSAAERGATSGPGDRIVLDLAALHGTADAAPIARYANAIAVERGDFNGRVLSLRRDDLRVLGTVMDLRDDDLFEQLEKWGVLRRDVDDIIDLTVSTVAPAVGNAELATS